MSGKSGSAKGPLDRSPSHMMHRALQLALDIYAEEMGPDGLTQRQFAVLEAVSSRPNLTQSDLVRMTGIDRSTLADLVARMTSKGLLVRERSHLDARAMLVRPSQTGTKALLQARPHIETIDARILALLPKTRREGFMDVLCCLAEAADAAPEKAREEARLAKKAAKEARKAQKAAMETRVRSPRKGANPAIQSPKGEA